MFGGIFPLEYQVQDYGSGRWDVQVDLMATSGEADRLRSTIDDMLDDALEHKVPDLPRMREETYFTVLLTANITREREVDGVLESYQVVGVERVKTFEMVRILDRQLLFDELYAWSEEFIGGNRDYTMDIFGLTLRFFSEHAGGCTSKARCITLEGAIVESPRSTGNNCFFMLIKSLFQVERLPKTLILEKRRQMGLGISDPVPPRVAVQHFDVCIYDCHTKMKYGNENSSIQLYLHNAHYYRYLGKKQKVYCERCHHSFAGTHSCPFDLYVPCYQCGRPHRSDRSCHPQRLKFYQNQIYGQKIRFLEEPEKMKGIVPACRRMFYDIETKPDEKKLHQPYIVGYDLGHGFEYIAGEHCMKGFVNVVFEWAKTFLPKVVYVDAFNGAKFDHFYFVKSCVEQGIAFKEFSLSNGAIVRARARNLILMDTSKHVMGSLRANLKAIQAPIQKGDFDHEKASRWEEMNDELRKQCLYYLEGDVKGLKYLHETLSSILEKDRRMSLCNFISTSQTAFHIWRSMMSSDRIAIALPTEEQEFPFRQSIYGGRCYKVQDEFVSSQREGLLTGELTYDDIDDYMVDLDVVSLYAAAMKDFKYPIGMTMNLSTSQIEHLNEEMKVKKTCSLMGIFHIEYIPFQFGSQPILPRREKKKLVWDLKPSTGYYTSVDIENGLQNGYQITITPLGGWYWSQSKFIFKRYIEDMYQRKASSPKHSPQYLLAKLGMNGLYGKMIQRPVYQKSLWFSTMPQFHNFYAKNTIHEIEFIGQLTYVAGFPRSNIERCIQKPSQLGSFVLAYSRRIMLRYMKACNPYFGMIASRDIQMKHDFYYTDTDSLHVHVSNAIPENPNIGGITNDLGTGKILRALYIAPKLYMLEYIKPHEEGLFYHYAGKGIHESQLTPEFFQSLSEGKKQDTYRDFSMKRIHVKRNKKQQHIDFFSILHQHSEETRRIIGLRKWAGRQFFSNGYSLPYGHFELEWASRNDVEEFETRDDILFELENSLNEDDLECLEHLEELLPTATSL